MDQKVTELTAIVPDSTDLVYVVHNPLTTPVPRKAVIRDIRSSPLDEPAAPAVAVQGTAGTTVYHYQVVANNAAGSTNAGKFSTTTTGNATLTGTNFNRLEWPNVTGRTTFRVYRQKGTDVVWMKIAAALDALTLDDTGIAGTE